MPENSEPKRLADQLALLHRLEKRARFDLDVRGLLAIITILAAFALAFAQLILRGNADIPAWSAAVVAGITGFYFGSRGGSNGT